MDSRIKEMEQKLFDYFNRDKRLKVLNNRLELLKKQVSEIDYKLKNIDYTLPEESISIGYEERVQTSPTGYSFAEKAIYNITDKLLKNKALKQQQIADIEDTISNIEMDNSIIETNLYGRCNVQETDIEFLEKKYYGSGKKDWQLGMEYGITQQAATDRKNKLIKNILHWEDWFIMGRQGVD